MEEKIRLIRFPQLKALVRLERTAIYKLIKVAGFPLPIKIGRSSFWLETEVQSWIHHQIELQRSTNSFIGFRASRPTQNNQTRSVSNTFQSEPPLDENIKLIRLPQVLAIVGVGRSSIYVLIKKAGFPPPIKIGSASMWIENEVLTWLRQHIKKQRGTNSM